MKNKTVIMTQIGRINKTYSNNSVLPGSISVEWIDGGCDEFYEYLDSLDEYFHSNRNRKVR